MLQRWHKSNDQLPEKDKTDIRDECPLFNSGIKSSPTRQAHPEFTQSSYNRIRFFEGKLTRIDYTEGDPKSKYGFMMAVDRTYGMQRIMYLHEQKGYKPEALFIAAMIFDQYIQSVGMANFPKPQVCCLATICVLLSAKLEQPISPSFSRMISLLTADEKRHVHKQDLIKLEE